MPDDFPRVLSIVPTGKGFGFAVLEGPTSLIDWGVKEARVDHVKKSLGQAQSLIRLYRPDSLVIEDIGSAKRRSKRAREFANELDKRARKEELTHRRIHHSNIDLIMGADKRLTHHEVTQFIAAQFPELARRAPEKRKAWVTFDTRNTIFEAIALALTYYQIEQTEIAFRRLKDQIDDLGSDSAGLNA